MKKMVKQFIAAALLVLGATMSVAAGENIPRPEYPRPQFERTDWVNLNGKWSFELDLNHVGLENVNLTHFCIINYQV